MVVNRAMDEANANHVVNSVNLNNEDKNMNREFNPSIMGREFVRQYYTMLNEGPQNLFRFYSDNSSLIHGNEPGENVAPAYGQYNINEKLMSLNFKDCHTKIRQVDSLETVNKSVVIQVIGELSNNGQPMRRFFQTFILAPKSPLHYYVRNDIFRYQDEVFVDEGFTDDNPDDSNSNHLIENTTDPTDTSQTSILNSSLVVNATLQQANLQGAQTKKAKNDKLNGQSVDQQKLSSDSRSQASKSNKFSCMNPEISPISTVTNSPLDLEQTIHNATPEQFIESPKVHDEQNAQKVNEDLGNEERKKQDKSSHSQTKPNVLVQNTSLTQEKIATTVSEPRTYATMVQRKFAQLGVVNSSSPTPIASLDKKDGQLIKSNEERLVNTVLNNAKKDEFLLSNDSNFVANNNNESTTSVATSSTLYTVGNKMPLSSSNHLEHKNIKPQRNGANSQLTDEQQVFVGNLPPQISEEKLREYFIEYGEILDIRICQRQGKTPNYGFITFNEAPVVKKILSLRPIFFNGHRINVEEKMPVRNFTSSGGFVNRKDKDHPNNRNFNNNNSTGPGNQFSAFNNNGSRMKDDRNRGFKDKDRKSFNSNGNANNGNRNSNSNFRR